MLLKPCGTVPIIIPQSGRKIKAVRRKQKTCRTRRLQALVRQDSYFFGVISLLSSVSSFFGRYQTFHWNDLPLRRWRTWISLRGFSHLYIGLTLLLTVGLRHRDHEDEFHITTFFRVRFARGSAVQIIGVSPFWLFKVASPESFLHGDHLRRIYLNCQRMLFRQTVLFSHFLMLKTGSNSFVIRGKHPVSGEPLFCFSANPDSLSTLCGFHINHRSTLLPS